MNNVSPDFIKSDIETRDYFEAKEAAIAQQQQQEALANGVDKINLQQPVDPNSILAGGQAELGALGALGI